MNCFLTTFGFSHVFKKKKYSKKTNDEENTNIQNTYILTLTEENSEKNYINLYSSLIKKSQ